MYADEYLPDDAVFEDGTDVSIDETSSMDTQDRNIKKRYELYKRSDSDYYSFKVKKQNEDGDIVRHKVEVYSSPMHGYIRNASSGLREPYKVGSKYEDLFFSVSDVGIHKDSETIKKTRSLFYRNPEEFERHQFGKVPQEIKKAWHDRYVKVRAILQD
jgi:hypothetical protein